MTLLETIKSDTINALKSGDKFKYEALKLLLASLQNKEIDKQGKAGLEAVLTDKEVQEVVLSEIKKRREAIEVYEKAGRQDLAEQEKKELEIISVYAPKQLSETEIKKELEELIAPLGSAPNAAGAVEMGVLMKECAQKFKGRADMGLVSKIAKELLGS
ncbi:MAG: GatB/YqeY domain-containing protein [Patescibacteria group bacterium]